jgi:hypothetical protein
MASMSEENRRKLWAAFLGDDLSGVGYINVHTYEVALWGSLPENRQLDDEAGTEELTPEVMGDQRKIKAAPNDWLRIPRFGNDARRKYGEDGLTKFAQDFFDANDIRVQVEAQ